MGNASCVLPKDRSVSHLYLYSCDLYGKLPTYSAIALPSTFVVVVQAQAAHTDRSANRDICWAGL